MHSDSLAIPHATTETSDSTPDVARVRLDGHDASLRQGLLCAVGYAVFVLALTGGAVWVWPRLGPWIWSHI
jgi:hypothetical protein